MDEALDIDWSTWSLSELDLGTWDRSGCRGWGSDIVEEYASGIAGLINVRWDVRNDRGAVLLVS